MRNHDDPGLQCVSCVIPLTFSIASWTLFSWSNETVPGMALKASNPATEVRVRLAKTRKESSDLYDGSTTNERKNSFSGVGGDRAARYQDRGQAAEKERGFVTRARGAKRRPVVGNGAQVSVYLLPQQV